MYIRRQATIIMVRMLKDQIRRSQPPRHPISNNQVNWAIHHLHHLTRLARDRWTFVQVNQNNNRRTSNNLTRPGLGLVRSGLIFVKGFRRILTRGDQAGSIGPASEATQLRPAQRHRAAPARHGRTQIEAGDMIAVDAQVLDPGLWWGARQGLNLWSLPCQGDRPRK